MEGVIWREGAMTPGEAAQVLETAKAWMEVDDKAAQEEMRRRSYVREGGRTVTEVRNNTQIDRDDAVLARLLWERVREVVPLVRGHRAVGVNERLRFVRYHPGESTTIHTDGSFRRSPVEASLLTLMVYLNQGFEGGQTNFYATRSFLPTLQVEPEAGKALLFDHTILHEGSKVLQGTKYIIRTDVMFDLSSSNA